MSVDTEPTRQEAISYAVFCLKKKTFMRMFGVGLTIAVLVDATLVRVLLVPAFMHVFGGLNWWAPKPLERWHSRSGADRSAGQTGPSDGAVGGNSSKFDSNRRVDDHVDRSPR